MKFAMIRLVLVMLAGLLVGGLDQQRVHAQQGDLSTIDDPLFGQYELYSVDDLVVQGPAVGDGGSNIENYILKTEDSKLSQQVKDHALTINCTVTDGPGQHTRIGRFFAIDRDVMVTLHPNVNASGENCAETANITNNMSLRIERWGESDYIGARVLMSPQKIAVAMADFTQDGLDDLFVISDAEAFVATAADVEDHTSGFTVGPFLSIAPALATTHDVTAGDLNHDGFVDVAWIGQDNALNIASICPGSVAGTICDGATRLQVVLNPLAAPSVTIRSGQCVANGRHRTIEAGHFTSDGKVSLVALMAAADNECQTDAVWYKFNSDFSLEGDGPVATLHNVSAYTGDVFAEAAALNWFGGTQQLVVAFGRIKQAVDCRVTTYVKYLEEVAVITFTENSMSITKTEGRITECMDTGGEIGRDFNYPMINGLAVGHFASLPVDGVGDETKFNLQIATLMDTGKVRIYKVNVPVSYTPELLSETTLTVDIPIRRVPDSNDYPPIHASRLQNNWLHAGDLQGRGMRLGAPTVVRVSHHSQPSVILGHPPMHVDYILPAHSTALEPQIINFSVVPETYYARFKLSQSTENQSTTKETTSFSYGVTESVEEKFKIKVPLVSSLKGTFKQSWENTHDETSENVATTQTSMEYNASSTTTLGDQIWFMENGFNLYIFPVLGQTVCPAEKPNCSEAEKLPLVVQFSGPNSTSILSANGSTVEWYQPVHQPGQVFSYPWNQQQLEARLPSELDMLSQVASFLTDDSDLEQEVSWSSSSETEQTVGTANDHSFSTENSLSGGNISEFGGLKVTGSYDYNNSTATESLNTSVNSLGSSTGIEVAMPGTFLSPAQYKYLVQGSVFGQAPSPGTVQSIQQAEDIKTTGPLHVAFIADPTSANAGSWWTSDNSPYTQYVDVALNHPARWEWGISTNVNSADDLQCLFAEASKHNCVSIAEPDPTDIWNSPFYWMRGLLVTVDSPGGPQRNYATAGDEVYLQARVYNYSLKDMDPDHRIKVRFYRQRMNGSTPVGDSVLIDEQSVAPLPGFNSQPALPNWTTVTTSFDTTELGNQFFIFWVVVWLEDATGSHVAELPAHGLTAAPGTLTSLTDVELEEVTIGSGEEAETLSFSNNVGFLHAKFYVAPAGAETATTAAIQPATILPRELRIEDVTLSSHLVEVGERVVLSASVAAIGPEVDGISVRIYHLAPGKEQVFLDHEALPYIPADSVDIVSIPFRPRTAGLHEFVIVATRPGVLEDIGHATLLVTEPENVDQTAIYLPVIAHQ